MDPRNMNNTDTEFESRMQALQPKRRTQKERILSFLQTHGSITRLQAATQMHIFELASRIIELEKDGWIIPRHTEQGLTVDGYRTHWTVYQRPYRVSPLK